MAIVDYFVDDLVNEHKVAPNALLVENAAVVSKNFHHSVDNVHYGRRLHVVLRSGHEIDPKLLGEEVVNSIDVLCIQ